MQRAKASEDRAQDEQEHGHAERHDESVKPAEHALGTRKTAAVKNKRNWRPPMRLTRGGRQRKKSGKKNRADERGERQCVLRIALEDLRTGG